MSSSPRPLTRRPAGRPATIVGAAVIAAVIVAAGVGGYLAFSAILAPPVTVASCSGGAGCPSIGEVQLTVPFTRDFGVAYTQVAVGQSIPASVGVSGGGAVAAVAVHWAPQVSTLATNGSTQYAYAEPGVYAVYATATAKSGLVRAGTETLVPIQVNPSAANATSGQFPQVALTLRNSSGGADPWIEAGGSVVVNASYSAGPADPVYEAEPPTLAATGGTETSDASGASWTEASYQFASAGYYGITLVVPVTGPSGVLYQNYSWAIFVGGPGEPLGCAVCATGSVSSPHPGTFVSYELAPGGAFDLDPAADFYSVGDEVGQEFDESLITFNGTDSGPTYSDFVPEVATCVPGSPQCMALYGSTMVGPGPSGAGENVTFVIDRAAHFFDPYTGQGRPVYPSDVMFTIIRALFYAQIYGQPGYYAGSDIATPLLPDSGNSSWDLGPAEVGLHAPYNNTPFWVLSAFGVNDSNCPARAMEQENGCLTFHASADGKVWPELLQILSEISIDGIQEAGWYAAEGAPVPGFVCDAAEVDAPCQLPGDVNTTNSSAYRDWVATAATATNGADSPYGWDAEESAGATDYPTPVPNVAFREVGSGPYYLASADPAIGYSLQANPDYQAPSGCAGASGCLPAPEQYPGTVTVYWEQTTAPGIEALESGYADAASFGAADLPSMWDLLEAGQISRTAAPSLETWGFGFNMHIDAECLGVEDLPADALTYEGLRAVLEYAYPYANMQATHNVADGLTGEHPFGGFLPSSEAPFYDAGLPWPDYNTTTHEFSDPSAGSGPGTATWYWQQANSPASPIYDPELQDYSASNPLEIPAGPTVPETWDDAWARSVANITAGVVRLVLYSEVGPICPTPGSADPIPQVGWLPDFASPSASWQPGFGPGGVLGGVDELSVLSDDSYGGDFTASSCGHDGDSVANLTYWADAADQVIPQLCQGIALNLTAYFADLATNTANTTLEVEYWDLVQAVYNNLQLTIGGGESIAFFWYAPWIDPSSINQNVLIGGASEWCFYGLVGNDIV